MSFILLARHSLRIVMGANIAQQSRARIRPPQLMLYYDLVLKGISELANITAEGNKDQRLQVKKLPQPHQLQATTSLDHLFKPKREEQQSPIWFNAPSPSGQY